MHIWLLGLPRWGPLCQPYLQTLATPLTATLNILNFPSPSLPQAVRPLLKAPIRGRKGYERGGRRKGLREGTKTREEDLV